MAAPIKLCLIAARTRNGVIGNAGGLPWRLEDDLAYFKATTLNYPIIMGRRTWESLPYRPLSDRENIVVSQNWAYRAKGARTYTDLKAAIEAAKTLAVAARKTQVFITGGESLYAATLPLADTLYLTEIEAELDGDTYFPAFEEHDFIETSADTQPKDDRNEYAYTIRTLERQRA